MSKLAIIILNKSNNNLLFQCLTSIKEKTNNTNYHVYIGDTGSTQNELSEIKTYLKMSSSFFIIYLIIIILVKITTK